MPVAASVMVMAGRLFATGAVAVERGLGAAAAGGRLGGGLAMPSRGEPPAEVRRQEGQSDRAGIHGRERLYRRTLRLQRNSRLIEL